MDASFNRIATRAKRHMFVEAVKRRNSDKRGGAAEGVITFHNSMAPVDCERQTLRLDSARDGLAQARSRQGVIIESRFFGGLEAAAVAELLKVSEAPMVPDWRAAKAWLSREPRR